MTMHDEDWSTGLPQLISQQRGLTLIEILIATVIIGILAAVAIPSYTSYSRRAARAEAIAFMLDIAQKNERYYTSQGSYCVSDTTCPWLSPPPELTKYTFTVNSSGQIKATPTGGYSDDDCGDLSITPAGVKASSLGTVAQCWR